MRPELPFHSPAYPPPPLFDDGDPHHLLDDEELAPRRPAPRATLRQLGIWSTLARLKFLPPRKAQVHTHGSIAT